jgi:hypothetical protein
MLPAHPTCSPPPPSRAPAGPQAYQSSLLGASLTIERCLWPHSWRLLDCQGRAVGSSRQQHIDPLLNHFAIRAANPLTILTEDCLGALLAGEGPRAGRAGSCIQRQAMMAW